MTDLTKDLYANGKSLQGKDYLQAIWDQDMEKIQWLYQNHCPWNRQVSLIAYHSGNRDIFRYFIDRGCPHHHEVTKHILRKYDTELLYYLSSKNLLDHFELLYDACKVDSILSVEWIQRNGYFYDEYMCFLYSIRNGSLSIMNWLLSKGISIPNDAMNECSYYCTQLDVISWIYEHTRHIPLNGWMNVVISKRLDLIEFFLEKETPPKQVIDCIFSLQDDYCFILQMMLMKHPESFRKEHERIIEYFLKHKEGGYIFRYVSRFFGREKVYSLLPIQGLRDWILDDLIPIIFQY